jgi:pumilio RNA-binding family
MQEGTLSNQGQFTGGSSYYFNNNNPQQIQQQLSYQNYYNPQFPNVKEEVQSTLGGLSMSMNNIINKEQFATLNQQQQFNPYHNFNQQQFSGNQLNDQFFSNPNNMYQNNYNNFNPQNSNKYISQGRNMPMRGNYQNQMDNNSTNYLSNNPNMGINYYNQGFNNQSNLYQQGMYQNPMGGNLNFNTNFANKTSQMGSLPDMEVLLLNAVDYCKDHSGSRIVQRKFEEGSEEDKDKILDVLLPHLYTLTKDVFGNYVIQKILEHSHLSKRKNLIFKQLEGNIHELSMHMYGCRVIQKAVEIIDLEDVKKIFKEVKNHIKKCIEDQNGNHVIQKLIERLPHEDNVEIIKAMKGKVIFIL